LVAGDAQAAETAPEAPAAAPEEPETTGDEEDGLFGGFFDGDDEGF